MYFLYVRFIYELCLRSNDAPHTAHACPAFVLTGTLFVPAVLLSYKHTYPQSITFPPDRFSAQTFFSPVKSQVCLRVSLRNGINNKMWERKRIKAVAQNHGSETGLPGSLCEPASAGYSWLVIPVFLVCNPTGQMSIPVCLLLLVLHYLSLD